MGNCYVVFCVIGCVSALALRCLARVLALARLARPGRQVGGVHAAPHAAAKLQPPHVPNHGGGIERLLEREMKLDDEKLDVPFRLRDKL